MKNRLMFSVIFTLFLSGMLLIQTADAVPKNGTLRISGDNTWVAFINGEEVAASGNWQVPTVSEFKLDKGFAQIAVYVHDAEPGAAGRGGFLADIILDAKPDYIGTGEDGWRCDTGKLLADRKDGWERSISTTANGKMNSKSTKNSEQVYGDSVLQSCGKFSKTRIVRRIGYGAVPMMLKTTSISDTPSAHFPSNLKTNSRQHGHASKTMLNK